MQSNSRKPTPAANHGWQLSRGTQWLGIGATNPPTVPTGQSARCVMVASILRAARRRETNTGTAADNDTRCWLDRASRLGGRMNHSRCSTWTIKPGANNPRTAIRKRFAASALRMSAVTRDLTHKGHNAQPAATGYEHPGKRRGDFVCGSSRYWFRDHATTKTFVLPEIRLSRDCSPIFKIRFLKID